MQSQDSFTEAEKKLLFAEAVRIGVSAIFRSHLYSFAGCTYVQQTGLPTGVRLSCAVARLVGNSFDMQLRKLLEANKLAVDVVFRYMDDHRAGLGALRPGWRWTKGKLRYRKEWAAEDAEVSPVERTARTLNKMMNTVYTDLQWTYEHQEMYADQSVPTLDANLKVQDNCLILFTFFQKSMAKQSVIHRKSAMGENVKIASLS